MVLCTPYTLTWGSISVGLLFFKRGFQILISYPLLPPTSFLEENVGIRLLTMVSSYSPKVMERFGGGTKYRAPFRTWGYQISAPLGRGRVLIHKQNEILVKNNHIIKETFVLKK